jgi:hypothetical protein
MQMVSNLEVYFERFMKSDYLNVIQMTHKFLVESD